MTRILISSIILVICNCTAYFNTYYNAETAFREGLTSHQKLMQNYPDSIVVTPPPEAVTKYDRAIEKAHKTIETFQKNKKWHDDALFLMGKSCFYKKEMEKAARRFQQLEQEFPSSKLIPESYLFLCKAYIEQGNLDKAEDVLLNARKRFPELDKDHQITLLMITIAIRRNGKSQAIALLEETLKSIRSDNVRLDLLLQTAELYIELKQYQKAILLLEKAPRKKDLPTQSYRIDRALFVCYKSIDSLSLAFKQINTMIENKNYSPFMDEMLYNKGKILHSLGETDEAIKIYRKLTAGLDSSSVLNDTSSFKAKALVELALIYQKQKEDYGKSYHYLKLAASVRDTSSSRQAKKWFSAMDRLKKLRDGTEKIDSVSGSNQFAVGELFLFELGEPDSAYEQFLRLSADSLTDSGFIPKALIQAAIIARDEMHDKQKSDSIFNLIIIRYPATEYAKIAQFESGKTITVTTRQDSAAQLYCDAERLFYIDNDVKGAIQQFYNIFKTYPDESIAPKSLFTAAWLSSTVLYKNKTAKMLYEKICEKYPQSIYCTKEAKPRIKTVVDTLAKLDQLRRENDKKRHNGPKKTTVTKEKKSDGVAGTDFADTLSENAIENDLSITGSGNDTAKTTTDSIFRQPSLQDEEKKLIPLIKEK